MPATLRPPRPHNHYFTLMKISIAFGLAVLALVTFTGCETERSTTTQTTTEETSVHPASPSTTSTQVTRSY